MATVLVPLANGCEELEAVTIIDLLRRAEINVITASLDTGVVVASRGVKLVADVVLDDVVSTSFDMIILPGGLEGADRLKEDPRIERLLLKTDKQGGYLAAICAAPKVLANYGFLNNKQATSYPEVLLNLGISDINISENDVVIDGNIVTSKGPGTAIDFALTLITILSGSSIAERVEAQLVRN